MRPILCILPFLILLASCAGFRVAEDKKPLQMRIYSYDAAVKTNATEQFSVLDETTKKQLLITTASMLCSETDPDTQVRLLKALTDLNAPPEAVTQVLRCSAENKQLTTYSFVKTFLYSGPKAGKEQLKDFLEILRNPDWRIKELALTAIGRLNKDAYEAVPDIVALMKSTDGNMEHFSMCFDALARIHPQTAIDILVLFMAEKSDGVRQNTVKKLLELDQYMSKGVEAMKEVLPAILRAISSGDEKLKTFIKDAVADIKDPETQQQIRTYLESTGNMVGGLMRVFGSKISDKLNEQEKRIKDRLKEFYEENKMQQRLSEIGIE